MNSMIDLDDSVADLFRAQDEIKQELEKRAWNVVRNAGYDPYIKADSKIEVTKVMRNGKQIVCVYAKFEEQFKEQIVDINMNTVLFDQLASDRKEK